MGPTNKYKRIRVISTKDKLTTKHQQHSQSARSTTTLTLLPTPISISPIMKFSAAILALVVVASQAMAAPHSLEEQCTKTVDLVSKVNDCSQL